MRERANFTFFQMIKRFSKYHVLNNPIFSTNFWYYLYYVVAYLFIILFVAYFIQKQTQKPSML